MQPLVDKPFKLRPAAAQFAVSELPFGKPTWLAGDLLAVLIW